MERWQLQLLPGDTVSGAVLAAIILISFLSLMSFADFLRVEWQQQQNNNNNQQNDPVDRDDGGRRGFRRQAADDAVENLRRLQDVDNALVIRFNQERAQRLAGDNEDNRADRDDGNVIYERRNDMENNQEEGDDIQQNAQVGDAHAGQNNMLNEPPVEAEEANNDDDNGAVGNNRGRNDEDDDDGAPPPPPREIPPPRQVQPRVPRNRPVDQNMNLDPLLQDDQVDMEINVALDELLGLRGPIGSLLRNLLWLLVFNTFYLGFFAFVPRTIGSAVYSNIFNTTVFQSTVNQLPLINEENENMIMLRSAIADINEESENINTIFRLRDFAAVNLGYLFCAFLVIMVRFGWIVCQKFLGRSTHARANAARGREGDALRAAQEEARQLAEAIGNRDARPQRLAEGMDHPGITLGEAVGLVLDATVAVVKVGILLFLKMFLLPVLLGIWLDGSSMELFGSSAKERISYAGKDLFSFILLHWVAGITFMLLVTVSVLQLREVAHPDLLAHLIRPQEPQPDLLGNLMHDSVVTQAKRMALSLLIYTALLEMHVSIPVKLLMRSGITEYLPFLELKFWHVLMPQLQVPIELLAFHLSMLALLEKYKNSIGELQHHWLVFTTSRLGLTDYILPKSIEKFTLVGHIPVFLGSGEEVNRVLYDIANKEGDEDKEQIIISNMEKLSSAPAEEVGETRDDGQRMLPSSQAYISLPPRGGGASNNADSKLLPAKVGRFRLKRCEDTTQDAAIEVWEEIRGGPVPRPPEGWDDLGAGGADIQGRWAWGKEKQSGEAVFC